MLKVCGSHLFPPRAPRRASSRRRDAGRVGVRGAFEPAGVGFGGVTRSRDRCGSPRRCQGSRPRCRGGHCRARTRSIGPTRAVLHIRSGPVDGGSTESCGSAPVLNAVEILPCAERVPVRMRKVIQRVHGGVLLGALECRLTTVQPSFSRVKCASRRPGRGGVGRRGPRDRRVTAEHVT